MARRRLGSGLGGAAAVLLLTQACTTVIVPPVAPAEPGPVFLLDHGRHASLVLPRGDDGMVRYSYGEWKYYAQVRTGIGEASAAVLWPTRAGLLPVKHAGTLGPQRGEVPAGSQGAAPLIGRRSRLFTAWTTSGS